MTRKSTVLMAHDSGGEYEVEIFDCENPKSVVVCAHGNGVRRWDGENFFYAVAEQYPEHAFLLVDQNQPYEDGCQLNDLDVMIARVQGLIEQAAADYPDTPIIVMGHSMGCGVAAELNLDVVAKLIFVAPTAGDETTKLLKRYGNDILTGKVVKSSDGLTKFLTKEYVRSVQGIVWEDEYRRLLSHYKPVYVFESGAEEIVGEERLQHRSLPFAEYKIIPGATHNLHGAALKRLFVGLDTLL